MGPSFSVLNIVCFVRILIYLWRYFGFVGFDLTKFKPLSAVSRIWSMVPATGFPLLGLLSSFEDRTRKTLVGIGIATILVPAIVPDLEASFPSFSHITISLLSLSVNTALRIFAGYDSTENSKLAPLVCPPIWRKPQVSVLVAVRAWIQKPFPEF